MKKQFKYAMLLAVTALSAPQAFACFTVYNSANQIVYNAQTPPVNMSYQIHQVLPPVYPGGHMVFGQDPDCPVVSAVYVRQVVARSTDRRPGEAGMRPKPDRN
ncbi:MAG: hypothetical protein V4757_03765 [Pseudomonadota bacterium]